MSGVQTVRKRPVVVQALWFDGENIGEVLQFIGSDDALVGHNRDAAYILIHTLEGDMRADVGDWIIKGVESEFYPVKPQIFESTYEVIGAAYPAGG